jgi:hypothetical protein
MMLLDMLDNISEQLRLSPISTSANIVQWMTQAIKSICIKSRFLEKFAIIPAKKDVARYLLPGDHIATTGALFDGATIGRINVKEAEFVSPTLPTYYYEDEWEDEASEAGVSEFATHYTLNELWPLQLMRSQPSAGAKTITLVHAPTVDGTAAASPIVGVLDGTVDSTSLIWMNPLGMVVSALSTEGNLLVFYKYIDTLPIDAETEIEYSDLMGLLYNAETLSLALSTEDDEYDRYRSWLYDHIATSVSGLLGGMSVNRSIR